MFKDNVRILSSESCLDLEDCIRLCFEETVLELKSEDLLKLGWLPRDCVVVVKDGGGSNG